MSAGSTRSCPWELPSAGICGAAGVQGAGEVPVPCAVLAAADLGTQGSGGVGLQGQQIPLLAPVLGWRNFREDVPSLEFQQPHGGFGTAQFQAEGHFLTAACAGAHSSAALLNPSCSDSGFLCLPQ